MDSNLTIAEFFKAKYINCIVYLNNEVLIVAEQQFDYGLKLRLCNPETNSIDVLFNYLHDITFNKTADQLWADAVTKYNVISPIIGKWDIQSNIDKLIEIDKNDDDVNLTLIQIDAEWYKQLQTLMSTAQFIILNKKVFDVANSLLALRLKHKYMD